MHYHKSKIGGDNNNIDINNSKISFMSPSHSVNGHVLVHPSSVLVFSANITKANLAHGVFVLYLPVWQQAGSWIHNQRH